MDPITDKDASISNRAMLDHCDDNVIGEKLIWCLAPALAFAMRCEIDVTRNGVTNVVVVDVVVIGIDVGATINMVLLVNKNVATVVNDILNFSRNVQRWKKYVYT